MFYCNYNSKIRSCKVENLCKNATPLWGGVIGHIYLLFRACTAAVAARNLAFSVTGGAFG
jgi:hypothetical protein